MFVSREKRYPYIVQNGNVQAWVCSSKEDRLSSFWKRHWHSRSDESSWTKNHWSRKWPRFFYDSCDTKACAWKEIKERSSFKKVWTYWALKNMPEHFAGRHAGENQNAWRTKTPANKHLRPCWLLRLDLMPCRSSDEFDGKKIHFSFLEGERKQTCKWRWGCYGNFTDFLCSLLH